MTAAPTSTSGPPGLMLAAALRHLFAPQPPEDPTPTLLGRVIAWLARQQQRAALAALDDHQLADIGVSRAEAMHESRRWT